MIASGSARVAPGRSCGTCMMCCKVLFIEEFNKPPGLWCEHALPGRGCSNYAERPSTCQDFYCRWIQDERLGPEWKPDKARFLVFLQRNGVNLQIAVDPGFPNAWTRRPYYPHIKQWAREGVEQGRFVFVRVGAEMIVVLPEEDRRIGEVAAEDDILISRQIGPAGYTYSIEVRRKAPAAARVALGASGP